MQKNPGDGLLLTRGSWSWELAEASHYRLRGLLQFQNVSKKSEIFVSEVEAKLVLLSQGSLEGVTSSVQIVPRHPGGKPEARPDGYWRSYITRAREATAIEVVIDIHGPPADDNSNGRSLLRLLKTARLDVEYVAYGPHGRTRHAQHVILPLHFPAVATPASSAATPTPTAQSPRWHNAGTGSQVLPVPTHLLCHLDDPLQVIRKYVLPHVQPGDIITIGETPLAIMQGRFRHPRSVRAGHVARLACKPFHPTSSLATACGMQALIDVVGRVRVIFAIIGAVLASRGMFYRLAGEQARLIDDVTGTLPPYDQFITLGPLNVQSTVDALKAKTGCEVAVVDVNDLKRVQILAASDGVNHKALAAALIDNPAGNADEQTPLVIVRGVRKNQ
eukprot:jgi/Mesen1/4561/ME000232S03826